MTVTESPCDVVLSHVEFPFTLTEFQRQDIDDLAPLEASALYWKPGLGKTAGSTCVGLYKLLTGAADQIVVIIPPILDTGWRKFLQSLKFKCGRKLDIVSYKGTPAKRRAMSLKADVVLVSRDIYKRDYDRFMKELKGRKLHFIRDEATDIKNVGTDNYRKFRDHALQHSFQLLTGTPLTTPIDGYAYIKLLAPSVYRNLAQFKRIHIAEIDFWGTPTAWQNLDLLRENMSLNAKFRGKEELKLEKPQVIPLHYEMDPQHLKLYQKIVDEQLLNLPDGGKIDATSAAKLRHALGQVVLNWAHFSQDEKKVPKAFELVEAILEELGAGSKLVLSAQYRMSNALIVKHFKHHGAVGVWGGVTPVQKDLNIKRFTEDENCRIITLQPSSAGYGVDGLQRVCSDMLLLEPPVTPTEYEQVTGRLDRAGAIAVPTIRLACATGTLQVRGLNQLAEKDALISPVQYSKSELREILLGG